MRRILLVALVGTVLAACGASGSTGTSPRVARSDPGVRPQGFTTATVSVRRADGTVCELCAYLADTPDERSHGLMRVTDLDGHDGMLFVYDEADLRRFWMKNTVMPLTAAWFAGDGTFVAAYDMAPCLSTAPDCPTYGPDTPASHVLEVPVGELERLGIGPGARLEAVGPPCRPTG